MEEARGMPAVVPAPPGRPDFRWFDYFAPRTIPFWLVHAAAVAGVVLCGWSWTGLLVAVAAYFVRMVIVTAGYHRYFSHRAFKTSRAFQLVLAVLAQSAAQKGVVWWAAHHRRHHKYSDTPEDVHSVRQSGFWYSHLGWILSPKWEATDHAMVTDLGKYPELRLLNRASVQLLPAGVLALVTYLVGGLPGLVWGFLVSTVLLWHGSFSINSLSHLFGRRPYATSDDSRNNLLLALITTGEGWHNNHHHYQSSANQGFRWWQIDVTYYVLRALAVFGLVWDLRRPPAHVLAPVAAEPVPAATDAPAARGTPGGIAVRVLSQ
jgi:stearoyl-CoA desaturase (Delta-9 desaturase)